MKIIYVVLNALLLSIISALFTPIARAQDLTSLYRNLTNGKCSDSACYNRYVIQQATNGKCSDSACYNRYVIQQATNGKCSDIACYRKLNPNVSVPSIGGTSRYSRSYSYDVSGYGSPGYVTGSIEADGSRDVEGILTLPDGRTVRFGGEWARKGVVEGTDELGNYYELEVD